jgi:DNA-binding SARP family transcriptional activator
LQYRVLGYLTVVRDDGVSPRLPRKQRELVAVLLLHAGEPCTRDMLVHALWGGSLPASPERALQICMCRARQAMGPGGCLRTLDDGALCAEPSPGDLDLTRFLQLRSTALRQLEHGHLRPARQAFEQALDCWRDPPLPGVCLEQGPPWACWRDPPLPDLPAAPEVAVQRTRLLKEREMAWLALADILLALGDHERLLPALHAGVVAEPLCERSWAQLIVALHQSGRSGEALAAYSKARGEIVRALGTEPGAELQNLRDLVLAGHAGIIPARWSFGAGMANEHARLDRPRERRLAVAR